MCIGQAKDVESSFLELEITALVPNFCSYREQRTRTSENTASQGITGDRDVR